MFFIIRIWFELPTEIQISNCSPKLDGEMTNGFYHFVFDDYLCEIICYMLFTDGYISRSFVAKWEIYLFAEDA